MASFVSGGVVADEETIRFGGHLKIGPAPIGRSADEVAPFGPDRPRAPFNSFLAARLLGRATLVQSRSVATRLQSVFFADSRCPFSLANF
jgi:hypothetical protein